MSIQEFIERNAQVKFGSHVEPQTAEYFKGLERSTLKITASLNEQDQAYVKSCFTVPVMFQAPAKPEVRPHPALNAVRDGMRKVYDGLRARTNNLNTLFIGATNREIQNGLTKGNFSYSIYGEEPKDDNRTYVSMLDKISSMLHKGQKEFPGKLDDVDLCMSRHELTELYCLATGLGDRIGVNLERSGKQYSRLLYEDSFYNKNFASIYEDFKSTGANYGLAIGMLPPELIEDMVPLNDQYRLQIKGDMARMTDVRGFANGYQHIRKDWATMLTQPAYNGKDFNLVFEIVARAGPFVIVEISRTRNGGVVLRDLTVLSEPYVLVRNVLASFKRPETLRELVRRKYVSLEDEDSVAVKKSEIDSVKSYVSSIATKSLELPTIVSFIRRRSGGAQLIDRVYTKKWDLETDVYLLIAIVVMVQVLYERNVAEESLGTLTAKAWYTKLIDNCLDFNIPDWFVGMCFTEGLAPKLTKLHDPVKQQEVTLRKHEGEQVFNLKSLVPVVPLEPEKAKECSVCKMFPSYHPDDTSNLQVMKCGKDSQLINFEMTDEALRSFLETMTPEDDDAVGLKMVKEAAKKAMPKTGFQNTVETVTIVGAFGTGKSHLIKKHVTNQDVVLAPFKKLLADYDVDSDNDPIYFKTNHRAIAQSRKARYLYIDEVGSMPAEYITTFVHLYQPEKLILIGDMKQTKTTGSEGTCIDTVVNFSGSHYLWKNFRNPVSVINWAVKKYGYDMVPAGPQFNSTGPLYKIVTKNHKEGVRVISPDRDSVNAGTAENTIRQYQGQTVDELVIKVTPSSLATFCVPCIKLVGLTRARKTTYLWLDAGVSKDTVESVIQIKEYAGFKEKAKASSQENVGRFMLALAEFSSRRAAQRLVDAVTDTDTHITTAELKERRKALFTRFKKGVPQVAEVKREDEVLASAAELKVRLSVKEQPKATKPMDAGLKTTARPKGSEPARKRRPKKKSPPKPEGVEEVIFDAERDEVKPVVEEPKPTVELAEVSVTQVGLTPDTRRFIVRDWSGPRTDALDDIIIDKMDAEVALAPHEARYVAKVQKEFGAGWFIQDT